MSKEVYGLCGLLGTWLESYFHKYGIDYDYKYQYDTSMCEVTNDTHNCKTLILYPFNFNSLTKPESDTIEMDALYFAANKNINIILAPDYSYHGNESEFLEEVNKKVYSKNYSNLLFEKKDLPEIFKGKNIKIVQPELVYNEKGEIISVEAAPWQRIFEIASRKKLIYKNVGNAISDSTRELIKANYPAIKQMADVIVKYKKPNDDFDDFIATKVPDGGILVTSLGMQAKDITINDICYIRSWNNKIVVWEGEKQPTQAAPLIIQLLEKNSRTNVIVSAGYYEMINNYYLKYYTSFNYVLCGIWNAYKDIFSIDDRIAVMRMSNVIVRETSFENASIKLENLFKKLQRRNNDKKDD